MDLVWSMLVLKEREKKRERVVWADSSWGMMLRNLMFAKQSVSGVTERDFGAAWSLLVVD